MIPTAIRNGNSQFSDKSIRLSYGTLTQVLTPRSACGHLQTVLWPGVMKAAKSFFFYVNTGKLQTLEVCNFNSGPFQGETSTFCCTQPFPCFLCTSNVLAARQTKICRHRTQRSSVDANRRFGGTCCWVEELHNVTTVVAM